VEPQGVEGSIRAWLLAFGLTTAIETSLLAWLGRRAEPRLVRRVGIALLGNAASHPVVWFAFPALGLGWGQTTALSEAWAWLLEATLYRLALHSASWRVALGLSFAANMASFVLGLVLWALHVIP
jgi:hypothetical protein